MTINQIKPKSKSKILTAFIVLGCIALGVLKSIVNHPPHTDSPSHPKHDYLTLNLQGKISNAIKNDDWEQLQSLYKVCKIEEENGFKYWSPRNCKPIILIQNSIKLNARKVYHGLANDPKYELSRSWTELEESYFENQPDKTTKLEATSSPLAPRRATET